MNNYLINAPAGSGKTTEIKRVIDELVRSDRDNRILCITYTNRAALELAMGINSENITIGTIHSFLNHFLKQYFSHEEVVALYFELYEERIIGRIANVEENEGIAAGNDRYKEKYGELTIDAVRQNLSKISYNESPSNSLYYGGLSHDELILFAYEMFERFPRLQERLGSRYQYVFIDEYQDTTADVLRIFHMALSGAKTQVLLYGDQMQQIYKNYDGSFEEELAGFDKSKKLSVNYRSVPKIIDILNSIYNEEEYFQSSSEAMVEVESLFDPRVIISPDIEKEISAIIEEDSNTLVLHVLNKHRFEAIGCVQFYEAIGAMEKYAFGRMYSAVDVLSTEASENPDPLVRLIYHIVEMRNSYREARYGITLRILRANKRIFRSDSWQISSHSEKERVFRDLSSLFEQLEKEDSTFGDLVEKANELRLLNPNYLDDLDEDYEEVLGIRSIEAIKMVEYINDPRVSTQHGVKGESHESVLFVAGKSSNPAVHIDKLFDMWSKVETSLSGFNQFYYSYNSQVSELDGILGMAVGKLNAKTYEEYGEILHTKANQVMGLFKESPYFGYLCESAYETYLRKPNVTNVKKCFNKNSVYGVLSAYKLFYVGCSRARKNLTVLVDPSLIIGEKDLVKAKFASLGFVVFDR